VSSGTLNLAQPTNQLLKNNKTYLPTITIVILSVRRSVLVSRPGTESSPGERDSGFPPYDSAGSLVACDQIVCRWVRIFSSNEGVQ